MIINKLERDIFERDVIKVHERFSNTLNKAKILSKIGTEEGANRHRGKGNAV